MKKLYRIIFHASPGPALAFALLPFLLALSTSASLPLPRSFLRPLPVIRHMLETFVTVRASPIGAVLWRKVNATVRANTLLHNPRSKATYCEITPSQRRILWSIERRRRTVVRHQCNKKSPSFELDLFLVFRVRDTTLLILCFRVLLKYHSQGETRSGRCRSLWTLVGRITVAL